MFSFMCECVAAVKHKTLALDSSTVTLQDLQRSRPKARPFLFESEAG
jgi:hypothetical protein